MLPSQREGRTAWPQGGLVASCVGPQEESQSTDQMPARESPDVDHVGPHFLSQNSSVYVVIPSKPCSARKEAGVSCLVGNESLLQDTGYH